MRDYTQECGIFYREVKEGGMIDIGERLFLVQWERDSPRLMGIRRYAVLGSEFHILKLVNKWNRSIGWKYSLLPDVYLQEKTA